MIRCTLVILLMQAAMYGQQLAPAFQMGFATEQGAQDPDYQKGLSELDSRQWDDAILSFDKASAANRPNADAALYWKAYALSRAARREDALSTLSRLRASYPSSRWLKDARALELEIRGQSGTPVNPNALQDESLKLIAVNSLMHSEPQQALPILQRLLASNNSEKVKEQALFVLTQNSSPEAQKVLVNIARGNANPDLQIKAVHLMGMMGNSTAQSDLVNIYNSSSDVRLKRAILQGFMQSGSRDALLNVVRNETNPELRTDAIRQLALTGGQDQLWQIYNSSKSEKEKLAIIQSMLLTGGDSERLIEIAKNEKGAELRLAAVRTLALEGKGKALVDLARSEKDPQFKREIVQQMTLVQSKEVTDYMEELLR
jgi:tetratricopeptide (TPR) repeat protein